MASKFHTDKLTVEYPIQTGCHGTVTIARRIFNVVMRPLSNKRVQIVEKNDDLGHNRRSRQFLITVDFYATKQQVEDAVRDHMLQKHHVHPENVVLKWEKGDMFT